MTTRLRLLQGATALLYLGPLLAGLSGHGWAMALVFAAIFVLWSIILRPHLWPRPAEALRAEAIVPLAALVATQVLLAVLCLGLGRGFGGVMGLRPDLPFWFPAALSFLSVPLSRLAWTRPATGFDPLLHRAPSQRAEGTAPLLAALARLPQDASEADLLAYLLATEADPAEILAALAPMPGPVAARARLILVTEPSLAEPLAGQGAPARLWPFDPADLPLFATRALALLAADARHAADLPRPEALRAIAADHPLAAPALFDLAQAIETSLLPA